MTEPRYLSMADRVHDDTLPADHMHNKIAAMQAGAKVVQCDTVDVTVRHAGATVAQVSLPAFTRPRTQVHALVRCHLTGYLQKSEREGQPTSLSDFVLYLMAQAANEPRQQ